MITYLLCATLLASTILSYPFSASAATGEDYNLEIEGRYWRPKLDTTVRIVQNGIGVDINAVNDLAMPEYRDFGELQMQVKFAGRHKFNFSYLPLSWQGDTFLSRTVEFAGQVFTQGAPGAVQVGFRFLHRRIRIRFCNGEVRFCWGYG